MDSAKIKQRFLAEFGPLFVLDGAGPAEGAAVADSLQFRWLEAGTVLMQEGVACNQLPFVLSGCIRVCKIAESGREITLYRIQAGQSCILSAGCGMGKLSFPAIATAETETAAAFLPAAGVRRLMDGSAVFRSFVLEQYARRLSEVIELVEEVAFRHVDQRLHERLRELAGPGGAGPIRVTHRELALHIGSSREVVSRILKDWEERGLVELGRSELRLRPGFAAIAL